MEHLGSKVHSLYRERDFLLNENFQTVAFKSKEELDNPRTAHVPLLANVLEDWRNSKLAVCAD